MALHINLYHEIDKQAQDRRRDPFKLAGLAAVLIAFLFVLYYLYRLNVVAGIEGTSGALTAEWKKLEPQEAAAKAHAVELLAQQRANQALMERLQGRFYWAPYLELFAAAVPQNVQIMTMTADASLPGRAVDVLISGIAAGQEPRSVAEQFRLGIQQKFATAYSEVTANYDGNALEESPLVVAFKGQTLNTVTFRIRLQFKAAPPAPPESAAAPATAPVRRKK